LEQSKKLYHRPVPLSALCILTFIGSSIGFAGYFLASLFFNEISNMIIKYSSWHSTQTISPAYFLVLMVFFSLSLMGAIRMWKLHRDGYFLYVFAQLIILFLPAYWISWQSLSATNTIFTLSFITGYTLCIKHLK
jgi:hypothetical protein